MEYVKETIELRRNVVDWAQSALTRRNLEEGIVDHDKSRLVEMPSRGTRAGQAEWSVGVS